MSPKEAPTPVSGDQCSCVWVDPGSCEQGKEPACGAPSHLPCLAGQGDPFCCRPLAAHRVAGQGPLRTKPGVRRVTGSWAAELEASSAPSGTALRQWCFLQEALGEPEMLFLGPMPFRVWDRQAEWHPIPTAGFHAARAFCHGDLRLSSSGPGVWIHGPKRPPGQG